MRWAGSGRRSQCCGLRTSETVRKAFSYCRALLMRVSGSAGIVGAFGNSTAGLVSGGAWAIGEGANMIQQVYRYWCVNENWLDTEQIICLGQFVASALKFAGVVAILQGGSSLWLISQACGSVVGVVSGICNLRNKGYFSDLSLATIKAYLEKLGCLADAGMVAPHLGYNPNAHEMV